MFTGPCSGNQIGLLKVHEGLKLDEALARIEKPHINDYPYSVHVFRGVIELIAMGTWAETTQPLMEFAFEQSVSTMSDYQMYWKTMTSANRSATSNFREEGNKTSTQLSSEVDRGAALNLSNPRAAASYMEEYFVRMTVPGTSALYFYNCTAKPPGFKSYLDALTSNLHACRNPRVRNMPGINVPMFYVGTFDSITAMHVEDGHSDSLNLLHAGLDKLWIVVDRSDYVRLNKEMAKVLKKKKLSSKCDFPIDHKNIILTPKFLDFLKIRYEFLTQQAGDLLYIRYGVPHQVVNLGVNVAEAVNFGSAEWNICNSLHVFCSCRDAVKSLPENVHVNHVVRTGKCRKTYTCEIDRCERTFATAALLNNHKQHDHSFRYACSLCEKTYAQDKGLARHITQVHRNRSEEGRSCRFCKKSFVDLQRHTRERHNKLVQCSGCNTALSKNDMKVHVKVCSSMKFICEACKREFGSRQSLGNHRPKCQTSE